MPSDVPFREVRRTLNKAGWSLDRVNGSHHIFEKAGCRNIIVPVHRGEVRWVYARQVDKEIAASAKEDAGGERTE